MLCSFYYRQMIFQFKVITNRMHSIGSALVFHHIKFIQHKLIHLRLTHPASRLEPIHILNGLSNLLSVHQFYRCYKQYGFHLLLDCEMTACHHWCTWGHHSIMKDCNIVIGIIYIMCFHTIIIFYHINRCCSFIQVVPYNIHTRIPL